MATEQLGTVRQEGQEVEVVSEALRRFVVRPPWLRKVMRW